MSGDLDAGLGFEGAPMAAATPAPLLQLEAAAPACPTKSEGIGVKGCATIAATALAPLPPLGAAALARLFFKIP